MYQRLNSSFFYIFVLRIAEMIMTQMVTDESKRGVRFLIQIYRILLIYKEI